MSFDSPEISTEFSDAETDFKEAQANFGFQLEYTLERRGEEREDAVRKAQEQYNEMEKSV